MAKQAGGDANNTDDPKDKANKEPADDASGKGKGSKAKADQGGDDDQNAKQFTQDDIDAAIARDRQERRKAQPKSDTSTTKKKPKSGDDDEDDGESERHRKRAEDAEDKVRQLEARDRFEDELKAAGFKNPRKMFRLLKDDLTYDDKGRPENIKDLIAIAKRDWSEELDPEADPKKPKGSADGGAKGGAAGKGSSMNDFIRRAAGRQ